MLTVSMVPEAKLRSCETQLVQFVHDIASNLNGAANRGHKQKDIIVTDFAKAFDKVPRRRLLYKLDFYGIQGSTHKWISSWLYGRFQRARSFRWPNVRPSPSFVRSPIRIGPWQVLFLIFINDLPDQKGLSFVFSQMTVL